MNIVTRKQLIALITTTELITISWGYIRKCIGWFVIPILNVLLREYYLQYTNFLNLSNKELEVVSAVIPVHTSDKQEEIKSLSVLTRLLCSVVPRCSSNWGREGVLVGIVRMILWTSRWVKKVGENCLNWDFGGDCAGGCMVPASLPFCTEFNLLCIEEWVAFEHVV